MKITLPRLVSDLPRTKNWVLEGSRIYVDPAATGRYVRERLDILALLVDKVFVCEPSESKLATWGYDSERFFELVHNRVFVPIYVTQGPNSLGSDEYLLRRELISGARFDREYDRAVSEDVDDEGFATAAKKSFPKVQAQDIAFNLNWDIIVSQLLNSPLAIDRRSEGILKYRLEKCVRDVRRLMDAPDTVGSATDVVRLVYRILNRLPSSLSVDELRQLRKEKTARKFRFWLSSALQEARKTTDVTGIRVDEQLYRDFNELAESYSKKSSQVSVAVTGTAITTTGLLANQPVATILGGVATIAGTLLLPEVIASIWKRFGEQNWVYLVLSMKRAHQN